MRYPMRCLAVIGCLLFALPLAAEILPKPKAVEGFQLFDQDGKAVDRTTLAGKPTLVFFGYTRCPDICPSTLAQLVVVKRQVPGINVLFVSIDPADGPVELKGYADTFGVVATASGDGTEALMHQLGFHGHDQNAPLSAHPAAVFALDSQVRWVAFWKYPQDAAQLIAELKQIR